MSESEKTVFVWVSKKTPGPTQQPSAASHDSWITVISTTIPIHVYNPARQARLGAMENKNKEILSESEKTVFVWVSKKTPGQTQQPFGCKSRQLDHKNTYLSNIFTFSISRSLHFSYNSCTTGVALCLGIPTSMATDIISERVGSPLPFTVVVW